MVQEKAVQERAAQQNAAGQKKRTRSRNSAKRKNIMNAAATLFLREGFDATSMDAIAELAAVSKQTVYSHFGSKKDLFRECIQSRSQESVLNEAVLNPDGDVRSELINLAQRYLDLVTSPEGVGIMRLCMAQPERHPELAETFYEAGPRMLYLKLKRYLDDKIDAGLLEIPDSGHASWQFLSILQGEAKLCANLGIRKSTRNRGREAYVVSCVDVFLAAYLKR